MCTHACVFQTVLQQHVAALRAASAEFTVIPSTRAANRSYPYEISTSYGVQGQPGWLGGGTESAGDCEQRCRASTTSDWGPCVAWSHSLIDASQSGMTNFVIGEKAGKWECHLFPRFPHLVQQTEADTGSTYGYNSEYSYTSSPAEAFSTELQ